MSEPVPVISLSGVGLVYQSGSTVEALRDINLNIKQREFVCLLGPSGCGKSTLLNIVAGFAVHSSGKALVDGKPIRGPSWNRGVVFQTPTLYPWLNVRRNVEFGLRLRKMDKTLVHSLAGKCLEEVGLGDFMNHKPYELSGGMRQRACLARVLVNNPKIVLMDEPFGALDAITRANMQQLTRNIWSQNHGTFLLITHDVDEALSLGTRVLVMSARPGRILKEYQTAFTYHISGDESDRTQFSKDYLAIRADIMRLIHFEASGGDYHL
ncbi:MAG: ABC transporter ATP-binding protein [Spirochaetaceae bacterium]|jgi:taurine transport system ATP-binding protein|nr:ABC transporter ATP-binding protein [Spirochaetaceae bacterium]